ncbi:MAG: hypothetical protein MAG431_02510 [Chloroflexi bacterium]|nr:hypothetical protein [Chloroflexota bacterium]
MATKIDWNSLASALRDCPNVIAAWVFGSAQDGLIRDGGDLDVGVLFSALPSLDDLADLRANLQQVTQVENIDLVLLNGASSILRFEAVSGRLIVNRDRDRMVEFSSLAGREYEFDQALLRMGLRYRQAIG